MKISIMFLLVVISTVGNAYFIPNIQCACQQIITQQECSNWNCQWVTITAGSSTTPEIGYCEQVPCAQLNETACKSETARCYYQEPGQSTPSQVCYEFSKCEDIVLQTGGTCQLSNNKCVPSPLKDSQCIFSGFFCSGLSKEQCSPQKGQTLVDEGLCYWNGTSCKVVTQCAEINSDKQCELFKNACQWTGTACIPQTCQSLYTNYQICTFVQTTTYKNSFVQPCYLEGNSCADFTKATEQLTNSNCASNTNNHFRWVPTTSTNGYCVQCNPFKYVFRNQCECQQLLQQAECQSNLNCSWTNTGTCSTNQCISYKVQSSCAQVKGCYWNATANPPACASYTSCSSISGKNAQACYSQSIHCPGSNGTTCQSQEQLNPCSSVITPMQPNICYNAIGKDGYCTYDIGQKQCQNITGCSQLTTIALCNQFSNSCIWKTGTTHSCINRTCQDYMTESSCTFIQNNITNNIINICTWNYDTKKCNAFDNSFSYDINSCFNSTGGTHHWSEPSNVKKGLCLPCYYSSVLNVKSNCSCKELTNYTDCALSSPKCYWNASTGLCQNQTCSQLTSQATCILSKYCYWSTASGCQGVGSSTVTCSSLTANTQQECLTQSIVCAGISNGKCSSSPNSCSDFNTFYQCFGSVGTDGICQWNQTSSKCSGISKCEMIGTQSQCELVLNTCYWGNGGNGTNICNPYNCTTLYTQSQNKNCNFYLSTPNQNYQVNYCVLSGTTCQAATNLSSLTSSNCYASSGGTARWDSQKGNGTCVICYSQIISVLFIILSYIML